MTSKKKTQSNKSQIEKVRRTLLSRLDELVDFSKTFLNQDFNRRDVGYGWAKWYDMVESALKEYFTASGIKIIEQDGRVAPSPSSVALLNTLTKKAVGLCDNIGLRYNIIFLHQSRHFRDNWNAVYRTQSGSSFALPPRDTMKIAMRHVHIGLKDVCQPGYQNDIAAAFEKVMEKERRLNEREAILSKKESQRLLKKTESEHGGPFQSPDVRRIHQKPAMHNQATGKASTNKQLTGGDLSRRFVQAYRNSTNRIPGTTFQPDPIWKSSTEKSRLGVVDQIPSNNSAKQEINKGLVLQPCTASGSSDHATDDREPGEISASESDEEEVKEGQAALLKLVDWLLNERTELQSAEASAKEECENLRESHCVLQELLERCLAKQAEELSAVENI